jgi:hypothetical protein
MLIPSCTPGVRDNLARAWTGARAVAGPGGCCSPPTGSRAGLRGETERGRQRRSDNRPEDKLGQPRRDNWDNVQGLETEPRTTRPDQEIRDDREALYGITAST